jgi:DNA-binding response OmpR family regulator
MINMLDTPTSYFANLATWQKSNATQYNCDKYCTDVLIVDDDNTLAEVVQAFLETEGFRVSRACNGAEGLNLAEKLCPKIMLLDFQMPVLDGLETLQILRQKLATAALPVIFVSADRNVAHYADMFAHTISLRKPFDLLQLTTLVHERCQQSPFVKQTV